MKNDIKTIYLHKKPWIRGQSNSLRWDAKLKDGKVIAANSASAVREASTKLLLEHGWSPTQLITFRHEGVDYDSFKPDQLAVFAENGVKNEIKRLKVVQERSSKSYNDLTKSGSSSILAPESCAQGGSRTFKGFRQPTQPKEATEALECLCKALRDIRELKAVAA